MKYCSLIVITILLSCSKKSENRASFSCPCLNVKFCSYFMEFRNFLYNKKYLSFTDHSYCDLYYKLRDGDIVINLDEVWSPNFDFRNRYVIDFESIRFCYDSLYANDPAEYFDSRELINLPLFEASGKQMDNATIDRVCARADRDPVAELAMLHLFFNQAN